MTRYTYDPYGNQLTETKPDGETEYNTYNALNQLSRTTDYNGQVTQYKYNSLGEMVEADYFQNVTQANAGAPSYSILYTYTALGQLQSVDDPRIGDTSYVYNTAGELTEEETPEANLFYTYDPATGNVLSISTNSTSLDYAYDSVGNLTATTATELNGQTSKPACDDLHLHGDWPASKRDTAKRRHCHLFVRQQRKPYRTGDRGFCRKSADRIRLHERCQRQPTPGKGNDAPI